MLSHYLYALKSKDLNQKLSFFLLFKITFPSPVIIKDIEIKVFSPLKQSTEDEKQFLSYYGGLCFSIDGIESGCTDQTFIPTVAQRESNLDNMITLKVINNLKYWIEEIYLFYFETILFKEFR